MQTAKRRHGFTLVELLIVIIIIGTLAGMMMISAGSATDKTNATRCQNDRKVLEKSYTISYSENSASGFKNMVSEVVNQYPQAKLVYSSDSLCTVTGVCPSGGAYGIAMQNIANTSKINVSCMIHTGELPDTLIKQLSNNILILTDSNNMSKVYNYFINSKRKDDINATLDSTGPNFGQPLLDNLKKMVGIDLSNYYWQFQRINLNTPYKYYVTWTTTNITSLNTNDVVSICRYNTETGEIEKGTALVEEGKVDMGDGSIKTIKKIKDINIPKAP